MQRIVLVQHIHSVPDAFGARDLNRITNVKTQTFGRDEARNQLARVQRDMNVGILRVQEFQHLHVERKVVHGDVVVLRHDQIETDETLIGQCKLESQQHLCIDNFFWKPAQYLKEIALRHLASCPSWRSAALQLRFANLLSLVRLTDCILHGSGQPVIGEGLAHGCQSVRRGVVGELDRLDCIRAEHVAKRLPRGREHKLLINLVLRLRSVGGFRQHGANVAVGGSSKLVERVEEVIVTRLPRQLPVPHGIGVNHCSIEDRV